MALAAVAAALVGPRFRDAEPDRTQRKRVRVSRSANGDGAKDM
jgi:hypothetical protein